MRVLTNITAGGVLDSWYDNRRSGVIGTVVETSKNRLTGTIYKVEYNWKGKMVSGWFEKSELIEQPELPFLEEGTIYE
jgi:hypothetical protein